MRCCLSLGQRDEARAAFIHTHWEFGLRKTFFFLSFQPVLPLSWPHPSGGIQIGQSKRSGLPARAAEDSHQSKSAKVDAFANRAGSWPPYTDLFQRIEGAGAEGFEVGNVHRGNV